MGRSRRYWPPGLEELIFVRWPHAAEQYKERAGFPPSYSLDRVKEDLVRELCEALRRGEAVYPNTKNRGDEDKEFVVRIAGEGREPVWALVEEWPPDGKYKFAVETVFTKEMFDKWNVGQKLGSMADVPGAEALKQVPTVPKPEPKPEPIHQDTSKLLMRRKNGDGTKEKWLGKHEVHGEILTKIQEGVPLGDIEVFKVELKKIKVGLSVKLEE